jgi:hypothetical protein
VAFALVALSFLVVASLGVPCLEGVLLFPLSFEVPFPVAFQVEHLYHLAFLDL